MKLSTILSALLLAGVAKANTLHEIQSPDGKLDVQISDGKNQPAWSLKFQGKPVLTDCQLSLTLASHGDLLSGAKIFREWFKKSDKRVPILFGKADHANDRYNEIHIGFKSTEKMPISVVFRCTNDSVSFRYELVSKGKIVIADEASSFHFAANPTAYIQYLENYNTSHEHSVTTGLLSEIKPKTLIDLPITMAVDSGIFLAITQAALRHYAGMSLMREEADNSLICKLTPRPDGNKVIAVDSIETPWRVILISNQLGELLQSNSIYCLNKPNEVGETSWIKPGKMTWPWWNGNVVDDGKDEPPIFTMEAQKKYIDFCAENKIPYHSTIADNTTTPWYFQSKQGVTPGPDTDVTRVRPDLDLKGIRRYADSKGVHLWTWVHQAALRGRVEEAFTAFEKMGWKGMMVDFFDHDDQESVEHAEAILRSAAKHHILIHFHGIWPPTGWQRTFPNLMNHEASLNLEVNKWATRVTPEHTLNLLFTRMLAGPMDYHSGGFRAVLPDQFAAHFVGPNVLGSRCNMLASYVCFDNPNPMVADFPDAYTNQPGFDFLKMVPTWWDETRVLSSVIGRRIVTARRKGKTWYLGCMSALSGLDLRIKLSSFLPKGSYTARLWKDSKETINDPNQLMTEIVQISSHDSLDIFTTVNGGFVAVISPKPPSRK